MPYPFRGFDSWPAAAPAPEPKRSPALLNCGHDAGQGQVLKKISAGQPGGKRWATQYGDALVCVRYRENAEHLRRYTTVEIVVDERAMPPERETRDSDRASGPDRPPSAESTEAKVQAIRLGFGEKALRQQVIQAGGQWDPRGRVWFLPHGQIQALGLQARIVEND